jgi:hypothetical protein
MTELQLDPVFVWSLRVVPPHKRTPVYMTDALVEGILTAYERGEGIPEICASLGVRRSAAYRALGRARARRERLAALRQHAHAILGLP